MITFGPRRALAALFCASAFVPSPSFAAAVAELSVRPVAGAFALPPAAVVAPSILTPSLSVSPAPLAAFAAPALAAPSAAPDLQAPLAAQAIPGDSPAEAPALAAAEPELEAAPKPRFAARARESLRSASLTFRALAIVTLGALTPRGTPALPAEALLRENQDYALTDKRGTVADGSIVETEPGSFVFRVTMAHPGLKTVLTRADAAKLQTNEEQKLAEVHAAVNAALPRRLDLRLKALERRAARKGKAVELGAYAERGRGDERQAALLANLTLARAGFKPKLIRVDSWRSENGRVIQEQRTLNLVHTSGGQIIFDTISNAFDGRKLQDLIAPAGAAGREAGIVSELTGPRVFSPAGKPKTNGVEAKAIGDKNITFAVVGRSAADRLFKDDQKKYEAAAAHEPVTIEWLYFPFYVDGHTALRIGDQLYEFTRKGWRASAARAFLFNNPYFEAQMIRHPNLPMPPYSMGVPLTVKKSDAAAFAARADAGKGWFSFWFNNCNQVPYRFLRRAGIALGDGAFSAFSSIRSFRFLLLHPPEQAGAPRMYPLPNQASSVEPLGPAVPRDLITEHSVLRDFAMFVWNWPKFIFEKLPLHR